MPPSDPALSARPPIVLCLSDYDALEKAALSALLREPRLAGALLEEVDRAAVVADADLRRDVVRLGSWVEFTDSLVGATRQARLVETPRSERSPDEISILTTEGVALVGLREGQTIIWPDRVGTDRVLGVVRVRNGPSPRPASRRSTGSAPRAPAGSGLPRRTARRRP